MSNSSGRALSGGKHHKTTKESCSPVKQSSTICKSFGHCDNSDGCHSHARRLKRLKTRKQRSKERRHVQGRGHAIGAPKSKSHQHHTIKDMTFCSNRCQHGPHCPPKQGAVLAQVFSTAKEPSIMTDCRLTGHRGLFNHVVKSIDIERLLSEQRKKEKETLKQKTNTTTLHFPTSCLPSPDYSNDVASLSVEGVEDESVSAVCTETQEVCLENIKSTGHSNSQGSDISPGQKVLPQFKPSFESETTIFSFANSPNALPTNKKLTTCVPESARKPLLTPSGDKENSELLKRKSKRPPSNSIAVEHSHNNQETQHCVSSPAIVDISSSPAAGSSDTFDTQRQGRDLDSMSTSIRIMASRLCHSLQLPILKRRNLLAESRDILLQALHERHGPQFQENLLRVQQCLSFATSPSVDKGEDVVMVPSTTIYTDADCTTNTAFHANSVKESPLDTQRTSLKGRRRQRGSNWRPPPQTQKSQEQAAECMARPTVEKVGDLFDELLKPSSSSTFSIDFLPNETSSPHPTFGIPTISNWEVSPPQPWEKINNVRMRESAKESSFTNSFLNPVREIHSGLQQSVDSRHSSLHYSKGTPCTFMQPRQPQDSFEFDRYCRTTSLCPQVCSPREGNQLHSFYNFNHPKTSSFLHSHYSNMMHYPPSHMLDKGPSPILPSLPSPEQCFFPPMRLY